MKKKIIALFSAIILLVSVGGSVAMAQSGEGTGFKVSPVKEELILDKGESRTVKLFVTNEVSSAVEARVDIYNGGPKNETGELGVDIDGSDQFTNSFKSLVQPIANFKLAAKGQNGSSKTIDVNINVPLNANPGAYIGAVRISAADGSGSGQVVLTGSVATIFLINVKGDVSQGMSLASISATKDQKNGKLFFNSGKMGLNTRLTNTGNTFIKPFGKVQLYKGGTLVEEFEFNQVGEDQANILPSQTRKFENQFKNEEWFGKYDVSANLSYSTLDGASGDLITAKTTFWVIPVWLAILISSGFLLLIFTVIYLISGRGKKSKRLNSARRR